MKISYICIDMDIDDLIEYDYLLGDEEPRRRKPNPTGGGCLVVLIIILVIAMLC